MIILIRWGAAPQGERCAINYTLAFWVNWLSDRVHFSLSSWMLVFFSRVVIQSPWRNPKTQNGSVSCGTLWRHLIGVIMVKGGGMEICIWCLEEIVHVLQWRATVFFFWKGIIAQCELLQREKEALALPALGGQIKSKMIHQLDSSGPVSVAATAAAVSTGWQLTISAGHTWLLCSVVTTHQAWKIRLNNQTCVICASVFAKRHTFNAS